MTKVKYKVWMTIEKTYLGEDGDEVYEDMEDTISVAEYDSYDEAMAEMESIHVANFKSIEL